MRLVPALILMLACNGGDETTDSGTGSGLTAPVVTTDPAETARSDQAVAMVVSTESEGASDVTYAYSWLSDDGLSWPQGDLEASVTTKGDVWTVIVEPSAGALTGPAATATVTIVNGPPTIASAAFTPSAPAIGADLACNPVGATDPDDDPITYAYAWTVGGTAVSETSNTLPASQITSGTLVECSITPNDGEVDGDTVSVSGTATNTPPTVTSAAITPTSPVSTEDLLCTPTGGADVDGDSVTFVYEWTVNSTVVSETSDTLGAANYVGSDVVICTATPYDGAAYGTGAASAPVTIGNVAPVVTQVLISPTNPVAADTIACTPTGTDADNDNLTWTYAWTINGIANGETSDFLAPGTAVYADVVTCTATAFDGTASTSLTSDSVTVGNSLPTVSGVAIAPTSASGQSALTCSYASTADADGQTVTVGYAWTVGGAAAGNVATLPAGSGTRGQVAVCTVTPNDTVADGAPGTASLTFDNAPPTLTSVQLTQGNNTLTCTPIGYADLDGDPLSSYTYSWTINGSAVSGSSSTLDSTNYAPGSSAQCQVTPSDGISNGSQVSSNTVSVTFINTPPVAFAARVTPGSPAAQTDDLLCTGTTTDPDGHSLTYTATWEFENYGGTWVPWTAGVQDGGTSGRQNDSVAAADTVAFRKFRCTLVADDGFGGARTSSTSTAVTVAVPPSCSTSVGISSAGPYDAYGECWYLSPDASTCDATCSSMGLDNINASSWNHWPDNCNGTTTDADVARWFYEHGNPKGWTGTASGSSYRSMGYGYSGQPYVYGKCADGSTKNSGAWPGDTNTSSNRSVVCNCGVQSWRTEGSTSSTTTFTNWMWGAIVVADRSTSMEQVQMYTSFTDTTCTLDWYWLENVEGDIDGPWVTKATGRLPVPATGPRWFSTPTNQDLRTQAGYSYTFAFGSTCTHPIYHTPNNTASSWGTQIGYSFSNGTYTAYAPTWTPTTSNTGLFTPYTQFYYAE